MTSDPSGEEPSGGHLRPTSPAVLTVWAVIGLVGGWLFHPMMERVRGSAPVVTWTQPLALFLGAAIVGALVGALVAGGYAGYAVSWLGVEAELASQRAWRSLAAAIAGVAITITAVLLERACRVRSDDDTT